jgi:mannose/fructose-specific phosphotransferase system component IIA
MKQNFATFVVAHEDLARSLICTVEKILGQQQNVFTFSNRSETLPILAREMSEKLEKTSARHNICFTDLKGGSCWTLANMVRKRHNQMIIISGVSLPMLVTYFNNKESMKLNDLLEKIVEDGCRGITLVSDK